MSMLLLGESMEQVVEIATWQELMAHLRERYYFWEPTDANVSIEKYGSGIDTRIGWNTHLVCIGGKAAVFTDGPMEKPQA